MRERPNPFLRWKSIIPNFFSLNGLFYSMVEFDPEQFITITFDIMEKVALQAEKVKRTLRAKYPDNAFQLKMDFQVEFREILKKFQPELIQKYNLSFSEFNQNMMLYRESIDEYLSEHPEKFETYWGIRSRLSIEEAKVENYVKAQSSDTEQEEPEEKINETRPPRKYPWGNSLPPKK